MFDSQGPPGRSTHTLAASDGTHHRFFMYLAGHPDDPSSDQDCEALFARTLKLKHDLVFEPKHRNVMRGRHYDAIHAGVSFGGGQEVGTCDVLVCRPLRLIHVSFAGPWYPRSKRAQPAPARGIYARACRTPGNLFYELYAPVRFAFLRNKLMWKPCRLLCYVRTVAFQVVCR